MNKPQKEELLETYASLYYTHRHDDQRQEHSPQEDVLETNQPVL